MCTTHVGSVYGLCDCYGGPSKDHTHVYARMQLSTWCARGVLNMNFALLHLITVQETAKSMFWEGSRVDAVHMVHTSYWQYSAYQGTFKVGRTGPSCSLV